MIKILSIVVVTVCLTSVGHTAQEPDRSVVSDGGVSIVIAASRSGKTLYGYSILTGTWEGVAVNNPDKSRLVPVVSSGVGYVVVGKTIHAFSAKTGLWAVVELPEVATPKLSVGDRLRVDVGSCIYMFSGSSGKWAKVDLAADKE